MFTGIVQELGEVVALQRQGRLLRYAVATSHELAQSKDGASIAVDGACQTVVESTESSLSFEAIDETLGKTTLGDLKMGQKVHLEPALRLSDRLDGHLVYGHVDGVARVTQLRPTPGRFDLTVEVPMGLERYIIDAGSICISGVSLTVWSIQDRLVSVSLIPETLNRTHFSTLKTGDKVNIEVDVMAKMMEKLGQKGGKLEDKLEQWGYR